MIVSAIRSDAPTVTNTAIGSTRMNRPGVAADHRQRQEGQHDRARAAEDRLEDLSRRQDRGLRARMTGAQEARDVFDDDDGVVDEQPERDDESRDRDLVERVAEEVQRRQSDRERQRNRDHDDARGAQSERQQRDRDQRDGDREIAAEPAETPRDVLRLIEADMQLDALRQSPFEALRGSQDPLAHVEDVVAVFLIRRHEHRTLAVEAADIAMLLRAPAHLRDVAHPHSAAIRDRDDGVAHFIECLVAAGCLEAEAAALDVDRPARNARVLAL